MRIPTHKLKVNDVMMTGEIVKSLTEMHRSKKWESVKILVCLYNPLTDKTRLVKWNKQGTVTIKERA